MSEASSFLIGPITQLLPMVDLPARGPIADEQLTIQSMVGLVVRSGKVAYTGPWDAARAYTEKLPEATEVVTLNDACVALPGFIDAHTHICFAGSRAQDYALRNAGKSYLEIAKAGGGIWDTVTQTRAATEADLARLTALRADRLLSQGVTTIEVKSGYGLSVPAELSMLRAIQTAQHHTAATLVPTCLAAHMCPKDFDGSSTAYLAHLLEDLLPILQKEQLTQRIDIFVEQSAFSVAEARLYLLAAREAGFQLTVHADQFTVGGSALAVDVKALSADHLEASSEAEIEYLAQSDTVAVALPGASLGLGCAFTPARKLLDAGAILAIASDWNPGSAPMGNLLTQAAVLGTFEKLTNAEVLAGITKRAAQALGQPTLGKLAVGSPADFVLFPTADYREILYQQGQLCPSHVFKTGKLVHHVH